MDSKREGVIFTRVADKVENKDYKETVVATFSDILKRSREFQNKNI